VTGRCATCRQERELAAFAVAPYSELHGYHIAEADSGVCDPCAEMIANQWNHARTGSYITWPNRPSTVRREAKKREIGKRLRTAVYERDAYRCRHCGTHRDLCLDHIIPESRGGAATLDNLQTLCRSCNSTKGTRV
jgi:5-methylcytosine-specific restriction endonuclease McrA